MFALHSAAGEHRECLPSLPGSLRHSWIGKLRRQLRSVCWAVNERCKIGRCTRGTAGSRTRAQRLVGILYVGLVIDRMSPILTRGA